MVKTSALGVNINGESAQIPLLGWIFLFSLSIIWGGSFFFIEVIVEEIAPLTLVALRVSIAALTLWSWIIIFGERLPKLQKPLLIAFIGMGILNNVIPFYLLTFGQSLISGSLAAILNATTPFFTLIVGHIFTKDDRISGRKLIGIFLAFAGVFFMFSPESFSFSVVADDHSLRVLGMLSCLTAALSYGFSAVWGRRFRQMGVKPLHAATGQLTASSLIMIPLVLGISQLQGVELQSLSLPSLKVIIMMAALGIVCTALAYLIFFRLLALVGASNTSLVTMLVPISAMILGAIFIGERLNYQEFIGLGLVVFGLIVIDGRVLSRFLEVIRRIQKG